MGKWRGYSLCIYICVCVCACKKLYEIYFLVIKDFCLSDVEAFAKAMETKTKPEQEDGDSKDRKDDEDMSLD